MSPELLDRFEPMARERRKQVVTNRVFQFFTDDSYNSEGTDALVVRFLCASCRDATKLDPTAFACSAMGQCLEGPPQAT